MEAGIDINGRKLYKQDKMGALVFTEANNITSAENKHNRSNLRQISHALPKFRSNCFSIEDYKHRSTVLFLQQAQSTYLQLAHLADLNLKYGVALRYLRLSLACDGNY